MELSTPEPWLPVVLTYSVPWAAVLTQPRWYSVRPGFLRMGFQAAGLQQRQGLCLGAHHLQQGGANKGQKRDHDGHRVAGQAKQNGLPYAQSAINA